MLEQGHEPVRMDGKLVDPEVVKKGVRNLMQQVAQVEREKDDYKSQITNMNRQLEEIEDIHKKTDGKLNSTIQVLRKLQDEKVELESKLGQKQNILLSQVKITFLLLFNMKKMNVSVINLYIYRQQNLKINQKRLRKIKKYCLITKLLCMLTKMKNIN